MAGHSKWANIKHKKAKEDAKRGKIFTKLIREITVAAKLGGDNKNANPRLRTAIAIALANNMNKDVIQKAINKGAGSEEHSNIEEVCYEGYGPNGVAIMVECMTDNRNRTVGEVRHIFTKNGGKLGTDGSVAYMFAKKGVISYTTKVNEDVLIEASLEAGAKDIVVDENGNINVVVDPKELADVQQILIEKSFHPNNTQVTFEADTKVDLNLVSAEKVINMVDELKNLEDVQNVYSSLNFTQELLDKQLTTTKL